MKQNTDLLELQLIEAGTQWTNDWFNHKMGEEFAQVWEKHILEPENMTLRELYIIDKHYQSYMVGWLDAYSLSESGLKDAGNWKWQVQLTAPTLFNNRYGRAYLEESRISGIYQTLPKALANEIENVLAKNSDIGEQEFLHRIKDRLGTR